jgi:hypothetical protein
VEGKGKKATEITVVAEEQPEDDEEEGVEDEEHEKYAEDEESEEEEEYEEEEEEEEEEEYEEYEEHEEDEEGGYGSGSESNDGGVTIGERVLVCWEGRSWYHAVVEANADGMYSVVFEDGVRTEVLRSEIDNEVRTFLLINS